jgi:hypothetical protein
MTDQFDFESFKQAAIKGLYEDKPLTGENGLFAPLIRACWASFNVNTGLALGC